MKLNHLLAVGGIFIGTALAWAILSSAIGSRTELSDESLCLNVEGNWGPPMMQKHPRIYYASPTNRESVREIQPASSAIDVQFDYEPKKKGLIRYRTYEVEFDATYEVANPTPIRQTIFLEFSLPVEGTSYQNFQLSIDGQDSTGRAPNNGTITEAVMLEPGASVPVRIAYQSRGLDSWRYQLPAHRRVRDFELNMTTNFAEIDFPHGTGSPDDRQQLPGGGWTLNWVFPDVIAPNSIGMSMPNVLNPGPTVQRITFFAPVSLLFFFAVLVIVGMARGENLHPMNYFFIAAGYFAFQLLLAYLVDVIPLFPSFLVSCAVSLLLVCGYIRAVTGWRGAAIAAAAQFAYMVLFSYSFFFDGLSGLTITIGAIATLALLMWLTAKLDWRELFASAKARRPTPPRIPAPEAGPRPV
ncbi:MAG: hypothetical protein ACI8UO_003305 [Verrucomicrobiales bacterium]|jgi:hypothetical protein